jgi:hypothetical protein
MQGTTMMNPVRRSCIVLIGLLAVVTLAACGGGGSIAAFKPGPLACDTLSTGSYQYQAQVTQALVAATGTPAPSAAAPRPPFTFSETIQGAVSGGTKFQVTINTSDGFNTTTAQAIQLDNNVGYLNSGEGWQQQDTSKRFLPLPYRPADLCNALAPDIDTSKLGTPQADKVNGIDSQSFALTNFPSQYFTRDPDFGGGSDAGSLIKTIDGTVWVANSGGYLTRMDITGIGQYPNGQSINVRLTFQVSDVGSSVDVKAPPQAS